MSERIVSIEPSSRFVMSRSQVRNDVRAYERLAFQAAQQGARVEILDDDAYDQVMGREVAKPQPRVIADDGVHVDESRRRWLIAYRSEVQNLKRYEELWEKSKQLGAELTIRPDFENPNPPAAA